MRMARLLACSMLAAVCGCSVNTEAPPPPPPVTGDGTLTVDWTIDEQKDPNLCSQSGSTSIEITVFYSDGGTAGTFEQSCEALATSITLAAGDYDATAVLLDGAGNARTTGIAINPFTIDPGSELVVPIDFPSDSFH